MGPVCWVSEFPSRHVPLGRYMSRFVSPSLVMGAAIISSPNINSETKYIAEVSALNYKNKTFEKTYDQIFPVPLCHLDQPTTVVD